MNFRLLQLFLLFEFVSTFIHAQDSAKSNMKLAAIPIINYNRTQEFIAGVMVSGYYKVKMYWRHFRNDAQLSSVTFIKTHLLEAPHIKHNN